MAKIITRLRRQIRRNPAETLLLLRMSGWIFVLSFVVRIRPLPIALRLVAAPIRSALPRSADIENKLAATIDRILRTRLLCFKPTCWKRAAILHRYLALNGIATFIVFGMRRDEDGTVRGHAWLEAQGKPILEKTVPEYTVTYTFPSTQKFEVELASLSD